MKKRNIPLLALLSFLLFVSVLILMSALWYYNMYGNIGFSAIIFTLTIDNGAVEEGILLSFIVKGLMPSVLFTALIMLGLWIRPKRRIILRNNKKKTEKVVFPLTNKTSKIISVILIVAFMFSGSMIVSLPQYLISILDKTKIYDYEYIEPDKVLVEFPEQKRNLIYIFLESMETSFFSKELGGALEYNVIPELYELASNNVNFSHNIDVGGWPVVTNTSWTIASLVSQTSGVPLNVPMKRNTYGKKSAFLPGIYNLQDLLKENGYYQAVMFGSEGNYAGRDQFYYQHGVDIVYDLFSAREDKLIPQDYKVWWGMEDMYLYRYAEDKLTQMASMDKPFAFTMLTVDTHHVNGYKCSLCSNTYDEQYENVYSCASKQLDAFIQWIKEQPFYENTTIIVCGDHASMDAAYFDRNVEPDYDRHMYNCIINSVAETDNTKERIFTPMDMFPTTLAAMGCTIEGDRLGLGTNLFSDVPTLAEKYTLEYLNEELGKSSEYYTNNFIKSKNK